MKSKKTIAAILTLCLSSPVIYSQQISWSRTKMDASRTAVKAASSKDIDKTLGKIEGNVYLSPGGKTFKKNKGCTYDVAKALIDAQDKMEEVKTVIGYSKAPMERKYPESELSNWFVDELMKSCAATTGKKVDVGIANFGGIRIDMPGGNILLDDMLSMFPFKNSLCYVALKGKYLREILENMAASSFQALGGVRCEAKDKKLISATIDGEPIEDEKIYGVCTISFLLYGGDGISVAKNAEELIDTKVYVIDVVLPRVKELYREGRPLEYKMDGRVKIYAADGSLIPPAKL